MFLFIFCKEKKRNKMCIIGFSTLNYIICWFLLLEISSPSWIVCLKQLNGKNNFKVFNLEAVFLFVSLLMLDKNNEKCLFRCSWITYSNSNVLTNVPQIRTNIEIARKRFIFLFIFPFVWIKHLAIKTVLNYSILFFTF